MSAKILKCDTCGAKLERDKNSELYCPNCGTHYTESEDKTYITNNNNITKVYYGNAGKIEENRDKIAIYKTRLYDDLFDGSVADARDYCVRLLNREPENNSILFIKKYIEKHLKQANGRYSQVNLLRVLSLFKDALSQEIKFDNEFYIYLNRYLEDYLSNSKGYDYWKLENYNNLCIEINEKHSKIENQQLKKTFGLVYEKLTQEYKDSCRNKEECRIEAEKNYKKERTKKIIGIVCGCLIVAVIVLVILLKSSPKEQFTVKYYASEGGCVAVYNTETKYSEWYECSVEKNENCVVMIALPREGYEFAGWSDGLTTQTRQDKNITYSFEITAYFRLIE